MSASGKFRQAGLSGSPLEGEVVIDAHMHWDRFYNFLIPRTEPADLIASARRIGIRRLYGSSMLALRGDPVSGNNGSLALQAAYPDTFFPYMVFKPNYPEHAAETIALAESSHIRRFKIHDDGNDLPYDHRGYRALYEHADSVGAVILVHTWGKKHVSPIMSVASEFPRIRFLLGHSGILEEEIYAEAVRKHENIFLETCCSLAWYGLVDRLVGMAGAERVLFGTDMPFMSPDQQIGRILFAKISDEEKRKVLGLNAQRMFG